MTLSGNSQLISRLICFAWLTSIILAFSACAEDLPDCTQIFLDRYEMEPYHNETLGCRNYLHLYETDDFQFAIIFNRCADLVPQMLIDCNGNDICLYTTEEGCFELVQEAKDLGIIGIAE